MDISMEYRSSDPIADGFESEEQEYESMKYAVQSIMQQADSESILDTLLIFANCSEHRALLLSTVNPKLSRWYELQGFLLRNMLQIMATQKLSYPNIKLEDGALYFPDIMKAH